MKLTLWSFVSGADWECRKHKKWPMTSNEIIACYRNCKSITQASQGVAEIIDEWRDLKGHHKILAWDTETTGLDRHARAFGVSLAFNVWDDYYTAWARKDTQLYGWLKSMLRQADNLVAHNARFDIRMMSHEGLDLSHSDCTYTMSRIYYDRRMKHGLKDIAEFLCPELSQWEDSITKAFNAARRLARKEGRDPELVTYEDIPDEIMSPYAQLDSFLCLMLYHHLWPHIRSTYREVYDREKKIYNLINKVEAQGLHYSYRKSQRHAKEMLHDANNKLADMRNILVNDEFNPNSPKQVLNGLRFLGMPDRLLKDKGKITTGADLLRQNLDKFPRTANKLVTLLLDYRALTKLTGTYLLPLAARAKRDNSYIYCEINPTDSRTGRMASRNPNLQNVPAPVSRKTTKANPVRDCFTCSSDEAIYYFDNEQMEMAYFGLLADDRDILEGYAAGEDIHMVMAKIIYGKDCTKLQRDVTKNINFGVIYGLGIRTMCKLYGFTMKEAREFLDIYFRKFPSISAFQDKCKSAIRQRGYVSDFWGRRYHIKEAYKAVNGLVSGGCAQAFKEQMLVVESYLHTCPVSVRNAAKIVMPVHDEIQIRTKRGLIHRKSHETAFCNAVIETMSDIPQLIDRGLQLRIKVERTVTSWSKKKEVKL